MLVTQGSVTVQSAACVYGMWWGAVVTRARGFGRSAQGRQAVAAAAIAIAIAIAAGEPRGASVAADRSPARGDALRKRRSVSRLGAEQDGGSRSRRRTVPGDLLFRRCVLPIHATGASAGLLEEGGFRFFRRFDRRVVHRATAGRVPARFGVEHPRARRPRDGSRRQPSCSSASTTWRRGRARAHWQSPRS